MWTCDRCRKACNRRIYPGNGDDSYARHIGCENLLVPVHEVQLKGPGWARDGYVIGVDPAGKEGKK